MTTRRFWTIHFHYLSVVRVFWSERGADISRAITRNPGDHSTCRLFQVDGQTFIFHYLTFFQQQENHYLRFDEEHHQITYDQNVYEEILYRCGFTKIEFYADFIPQKREIINQGERIFILAQK